MKNALTFLFLLFFFTPAAAQINYYNPGMQKERADDPSDSGPGATKTLTVTSIDKCYAHLSRKDVLEIQRNFIKPYQECQRRVALLPKKDPGHKAENTPDKPHNFVQVQKSPPSAKPGKQQREEDNSAPPNE